MCMIISLSGTVCFSPPVDQPAHIYMFPVNMISAQFANIGCKQPGGGLLATARLCVIWISRAVLNVSANFCRLLGRLL